MSTQPIRPQQIRPQTRVITRARSRDEVIAIVVVLALLVAISALTAWGLLKVVESTQEILFNR